MDHVLQNERMLLMQVAQGSRTAYSTLYTHYYPRLKRFVRFLCRHREDTEEVIQDCLLKVWERRETLGSIRSFEDYLFRMAKNRVFDIMKDQQAGLGAKSQIAGVMAAEDEIVEKEVILRQYQHIANMAVEQLSARRKEIFLMSTQQGMSLDEIASATNLSRAMVKKHLYSAIHFVRTYLRQHAEWPAIMLFLAIVP